jgi:hypothetical protein
LATSAWLSAQADAFDQQASVWAGRIEEAIEAQEVLTAEIHRLSIGLAECAGRRNLAARLAYEARQAGGG